MKKILSITVVLVALFLTFSCSEKEPQIGNPPQQENPSDTESEQPGDTGGTEDSGEDDDSLIPQDPDEVETFEIRTAEDLVALAASVNAGTSKVKTAMLMNDIDMSSVTSWTPIGCAKCPVGGVDAKISGYAWTGTFDGNGYRIKNLKMVSASSVAGMNYGLFGVLAPGSLVQNFIIDETCSLEVTATASVATGVVAGYVYDATVRDVTSYAPMTFKGKAGGVFMSMAMIGQIYSSEAGVTVDSCHNRGEITAENTDNMENGGKSYHIAGVVGFAYGVSKPKQSNTISDCSNSGDMTSATGRTSGIVAAIYKGTQIINCQNTGNQLNTMPKQDAGRPGNITCYVESGCTLTGCVNRGDLISTTAGRCGGITSLTATTKAFADCANYGEIITDSEFRGLFWGLCTAKSSWNNCIAAGKVGKYNGGTYVYDEYSAVTKASYLGVLQDCSPETSGVTYLVGEDGSGSGSAADAQLSILFIGNSFTKDAVEHLPGLLKAAGLDKVHLVHMYYGGRTIAEYNSKWSSSSDYTLYECMPGSSVWMSHSNTNLSQIAASKKWDIVTIQEHTGRYSAWTWNSTASTNLKALVDKVKGTQGDNVPEFHYILSQAYHNMGKIAKDSQSSISWDDHKGMWSVLAAFGKSAVENVPFDGVISTGVMLENLRTSSLNNSMDLSRDGYHMDNGIARYGAACAVFESLITPEFDVTLDGNSYRYNVSNTSTSSYTTPVTDSNAPIALQAARYAIQSPYSVTDMSDK